MVNTPPLTSARETPKPLSKIGSGLLNILSKVPRIRKSDIGKSIRKSIIQKERPGLLDAVQKGRKGEELRKDRDKGYEKGSFIDFVDKTFPGGTCQLGIKYSEELGEDTLAIKFKIGRYASYNKENSVDRRIFDHKIPDSIDLQDTLYLDSKMINQLIKILDTFLQTSSIRQLAETTTTERGFDKIVLQPQKGNNLTITESYVSGERPHIFIKSDIDPQSIRDRITKDPNEEITSVGDPLFIDLNKAHELRELLQYLLSKMNIKNE